MIEFDVETTGLQPWSGKHQAFLYIFYDGDRAEAILYSHFEDQSHGRRKRPESLVKNRMRIQAWFDRARTDPDGIRAWNAKFDRAFADIAGFDIPGDGRWHDGMLVAQAVNENRSVALKAVAQELFGADAADPQRALKEWLNAENNRRRKAARDDDTEYEPANYSHVPMEIMEPYALEDVILTRRIGDVYDVQMLNDTSLRKTYEFERQAMDALYAIEKEGLPSHVEEYRKLEGEVTDKLEVLFTRVVDLAAEGDPIVYAKALDYEVELHDDGRIRSYPKGAPPDFNPNSTAHVLAALKARGADMSYMSKKDGKLSADADNLRAVDDALAQAILDYRAENKVLTTYVRPMIGRHYVSALNSYKEPFISAVDSRIHTNYRQVGARTGRMSSSDPNVQNQPRDDLRLRYNIVADPGHVLVTCDLSNIEMVMFAAYCGEGRLLTALRNGDDLHEMTAHMVGLRDRRRPGGGVETARQQGKVFNFTIIYGGGLRSIKRYFRVSQDEARLMKKRYMDAYPEVRRLQTRIDYRLTDDGYIQDKLISGRRFRVDKNDSYKAVNYLVQGTAASLLKYAVIKLHGDGVPMVALVHDEIVAHVPADQAMETARLIERRMTEFEPLQGVVPLRAEADIVKRWSDAKPLKDENGNPYLFTPDWAGGQRRELWTPEQVINYAREEVSA